MAKKKNKKNTQKQGEVATPPDSSLAPAPAPTSAPEIVESSPNEARPDFQFEQSATSQEVASDTNQRSDPAHVLEAGAGLGRIQSGEGRLSTIDLPKNIEATPPRSPIHMDTVPPTSEPATSTAAVITQRQLTDANETTQLGSAEQVLPLGAGDRSQSVTGQSNDVQEATVVTESSDRLHDVSQPHHAKESDAVTNAVVVSQQEPHSTLQVPPAPSHPSPSSWMDTAVGETLNSNGTKESPAEANSIYEHSVPETVPPIQHNIQAHLATTIDPLEMDTNTSATSDRAPAIPEGSKHIVSATIPEGIRSQDAHERSSTAITTASTPDERFGASVVETPFDDETSSNPAASVTTRSRNKGDEEHPPLDSPAFPTQDGLSRSRTLEQGTINHQQAVMTPDAPAQSETPQTLKPATSEDVGPSVRNETPKQRRRREAEERVLREEQEELAEKQFQQYLIDQEKMEMARLEKIAARKRKKDTNSKDAVQTEPSPLSPSPKAEEEAIRSPAYLQKPPPPADGPTHGMPPHEDDVYTDRQHQNHFDMATSEPQQQTSKADVEANARAAEQERWRKLEEEAEADARAAELAKRKELENETEAIKKAADLAQLKHEQGTAVQSRAAGIALGEKLKEEAEANARAAEIAQRKRLEEEPEANARMAEFAQREKLEEDAQANRSAAEVAHTKIIEAQAEVNRVIAVQQARSQMYGEQGSADKALSSDPSSTNTQPTERVPSSGTLGGAVPVQATLPVSLSERSPQDLTGRSVLSSSSVKDQINQAIFPATLADRTNSNQHIAAHTTTKTLDAPDLAPHFLPAHTSGSKDYAVQSRHAAGSPHAPVPKPQAVSTVIESSRPPAPSPPISRVRPRHAPAFDSGDESDSSLVMPRRQLGGGEDYTRDPSGSTYPPQPTHHRSVFASRVPPDQSYTNPPPPQLPGYHPGYYPSTAPPNYQSHNYRLNQQGYPHPNSYGPSSHSSSSTYTEAWNYPPGYRHDSPPQRHDTIVPRDYSLGLGPIDTRPAIGDDPGDVFSRIAQAIPDLHVLLARYKETHGQLSVREELLRRTGAEQEEKLRAKDNEIAELKDRARHLEYKYTTEASRLRLEVGNLEEQTKELREQRAETDKYKREAQDIKLQFDAAMMSWESRYKELEEAHATLVRTSAEEKAKASQDFDEWKSTYTTRNDAEKIALAIHFDKRLKDADLLAESQKQEMATANSKEKEELRADHQRQQLERQASFDRLRNELETRIDAAQTDREESLKQEKARVDQLLYEKEELLKKYNALKAESEQEKAIIKSVATNLESEKLRLEKLMECYGDIAEIKSKGDTYYSVSFAQLQKQIIDLAATHFVHLPVRPPPEDLAQVPTNLPSFLGDSGASRQVRAAYIAHTVSKLITYRVFGPFLFSLGRRYDKADSLFSSMSHHIRDKSTRKEAIWRQQTLLAAFTSSGAKQRINTAAGTVVEEIVGAIKQFADPREEEGIKIAVKRIVKLAAETWRFARLEREMIHATMPALLDEEHQFTSPDYWPSYESYKPDGTLIGSLVGTSPPADEQPQLLLRLFPVIWRESKHENFHVDGEKKDEGCIYHHGLALYDDAESVVQRMEELKSAGLPTYTTASPPTIAESSGKFPPPIVPPPGETLPPPPAMAEHSKRSSTVSVPSTATPPPPPSSIPSLIETSISKPVEAYKRPVPGTIDFASLRNLIGMPPPIERIVTSVPTSPMRKSDVPTERSATIAPMVTEAIANDFTIVLPNRPPPPPPPATEHARMPHPATEESAILPHFPEASPNESHSRDLPTPPHSRSDTPTEPPLSPLFEAIDEIDALQHHRSRQSSTSMSRRKSTHKRRSKEMGGELPEVTPTAELLETSRRTSGYALSMRSVKTVDTERTDRTERSDKTERTDKTDKTERDPKSRYMCESRSAAVKALYPNSPLAGQGTSNNSKNSVSSSKKKDRESKELKREMTQSSIRDNGTWDTTSVFTSEATKIKDRDSKELKREKTQSSIPDNGTWDTSSVLTSEGTNNQFSTA